jgi:hypothetical protein
MCLDTINKALDQLTFNMPHFTVHDLRRTATLLANAASPRMAAWVRPSFTETLKLMPPEAVRFLDAAYARANGKPRTVLPASDLGICYDDEVHVPVISLNQKLRTLTSFDLGTYNDLFRLFAQVGNTYLPPNAFVTSGSSAEKIEKDEVDRQSFAVLMDELTPFQIWSIRTSKRSGDHFYLSFYAAQFLLPCHPPD